MKNIKQIRKAVTAMGLIGDDFRRELERQCLAFGRELISAMVIETEVSEPDFNSQLIYLAHFTEIFMTAELYNFGSGFAEEMQGAVFAITGEHNNSICKWRRELFDDDDGKPESEAEQPENDLETENTALLISGILSNPNIPVPIFNAMQEAIGEMFNNSPKSVRHSIDNSPEYIAMVLRGYEQAEVSE